MTMPSDVSYANSCFMLSFILMYGLYIFALMLLLDLLICCTFVNLKMYV